MPATVVVAQNRDGIIAIQERGIWSLPWPALRDDFRHLEEMVRSEKYQHLVMGYRTWEVMQGMLARLPSSQATKIRIVADLERVHAPSHGITLADALLLAEEEECLVLGGEQIYQAFLDSGKVSALSITWVDDVFPRDTDAIRVFPLLDWNVAILVQDGILERTRFTRHRCQTRGIDYTIETWTVCDLAALRQFCQTKGGPDLINRQIYPRPKLPASDWETQYRALLHQIWTTGHRVQSRSGETRSLFGVHLRCDLSKECPIVSCKKGYPKTIFEELLWMIRGDTDVRNLRKAGVTIWDGHSSEQFLQSQGLPWREGDIGPGYGFQMRYAGAPYSGCETDYSGQGVDQLGEIVRLLREDPTSRRIILNLWNVNQLAEMSLPPCHLLYQWVVELYPEPTSTGMRGKLNCHLFQRSWDLMLGWNPATAALLTHLLAATCHYDLGELLHSISDAHIYQDHQAGVEELFSRPMCNAPRLQITRRREDLREYQFGDTLLEHYYPMPPIRMTMAI